MANEKKDVANLVYITLILIGVVLSTLLVMTLIFSPKLFIYLLLIYVVAYSIYMTVYLMMNKEKLEDDLRYSAGLYITLFNVFFMTSVIILSFIFSKKPAGQTPGKT